MAKRVYQTVAVKKVAPEKVLASLAEGAVQAVGWHARGFAKGVAEERV